MRHIVFGVCILFVSCAPMATSTSTPPSAKTLKFTDFAYEPQIKTIMVHQESSDREATLDPSVAPLNNQRLLLQFDDLATERDNFYVRIVHCNYDWTKSALADLDFMTSFNEFQINNFEYSVDTHVPYIHYWFLIPPVKMPGNYLVIVYRDGNKDDLVLSKRFMIYDNQVVLASERNLLGAGNLATMNQQINFTVNYKNLDIINPLENIKVVIRQNQRWDNIASEIQPSFVREIEKEIEYRFFDENKMFKGGNEFRFFDMRSLNNPGRNVQRVDRTQKPFDVFVEPDKSRRDEVYAQYMDLNGGFILDNLDYRDANFSNYAYVNFELKSPKVAGNVYILGGFNYWRLGEENKMRYDSVSRSYKNIQLLKQGWYDYQYLLANSELPAFFFEGTHFETENTYEILIYYRSFQPRADVLIGYRRLEKNPR
jgi:hypothetical protein